MYCNINTRNIITLIKRSEEGIKIPTETNVAKNTRTLRAIRQDSIVVATSLQGTTKLKLYLNPKRNLAYCARSENEMRGTLFLREKANKS